MKLAWLLYRVRNEIAGSAWICQETEFLTISRGTEYSEKLVCLDCSFGKGGKGVSHKRTLRACSVCVSFELTELSFWKILTPIYQDSGIIKMLSRVPGFSILGLVIVWLVQFTSLSYTAHSGSHNHLHTHHRRAPAPILGITDNGLNKRAHTYERLFLWEAYKIIGYVITERFSPSQSI